MSRIIGIIEGEGVGPEIIEAAQSCIQLVNQVPARNLTFLRYKGSASRSDSFCKLSEFYKEISDSGGVVLRASIPAPICYQLRREHKLFYKLVPFNSDSSLNELSPLKPERLSNIDLLLIRHNNEGLYHGIFDREQGRIRCEHYISEKSISMLAEVAFQHAASRKQRLRVLIKDEVLGSLGQLWREQFSQIASAYPGVLLDIAPPDSGSAQIMLAPWAFDVIVTGDTEADMLSDQLSALICGTRALTPSVNCGNSIFSTYQTIHGTAKGLAGKDIVNPAGMILAAAWMLERSFGLIDAAAQLRKAVMMVLKESLPNHISPQHNGDLLIENIGTKRFVEQVHKKLAIYEQNQAA